MLQKLEADIRGHIRLEHEMKIHLDYLEGRVEELENSNLKLTSDKKSLSKRLKDLEDKLRGAVEEAERTEKRHKEVVDRLEREVKDAMTMIGSAKTVQGQRIPQQNMATVEYNGEQSVAHEQYKKIQSHGLNSG